MKKALTYRQRLYSNQTSRQTDQNTVTTNNCP